ncbi:hypothetical protein HPB50_015296 [Hyalomma asiaticum]|uniref:Uncharacterized protein n=1 Tax=Hyalomma asiaticum TaxID=266040 RepID=A0ACB7RXL5_HYAAI|nr:hypothetical protein HPB50_015296 [Hyalomma asiaticum]
MHDLPEVSNDHKSVAPLETLSTEDALGPKCLLAEELLLLAIQIWSTRKLHSQVSVCRTHHQDLISEPECDPIRAYVPARGTSADFLQLKQSPRRIISA